MKQLNRFLLATVLTVFCLTNANAQYVTTHAKTAMAGQQRGVYYSLPRTVIQLDFVIEEVDLVEGPYSDYVYLVGAEDYVMGDSKEYRLVDVVMSTYAEADPNATFFVAMSPKKGEATGFYLNKQGILEGVGIAPQTLPEPFQKPVQPAPVKAQSKEFKYQYGSDAVKGIDQQARSAAAMIERIRDEKIKLVTGFQETPFTLDTYRQMYADLDEMENEYLSLFIGKKIAKTTVKTAYVTLSKEVPSQTIGKFSSTKGFTTDVTGVGNLITLQAISLNTTGNINQPSASAVESISHENKLFYRIPETASVKLTIGNDVLVERRETIAQYGVFMLAPLGNTKLALDPETGQIVGIEN